MRISSTSKPGASFNSDSAACLLCVEADGCVPNIWMDQEWRKLDKIPSSTMVVAFTNSQEYFAIPELMQEEFSEFKTGSFAGTSGLINPQQTVHEEDSFQIEKVVCYGSVCK
ncbi:hypothetical protein EJB05_31646 [Eragrostis curvula]|uniref:Uncharacterized protein n=1 Tax=Eragrostis curvula TaxID=38414 RepID=A0A5J9UEX4_9POAL|nr:hypothetical protein EJB05_41924 [Eragrostis curvula]TVU21974.1 hypothetical protein EJB05_31646 [Eragrostis curvula]